MSLEKRLATHLLAAHPTEAAAVLETVPEAASLAVIAEATPRTAAGVLARLAPHRAAQGLAHIDGPAVHEVLEVMEVQQIATLVRRMEPEARRRFLDAMPSDQALSLETLLSYEDGTAGSLMDSRVLALPLDLTAGQAIDQIRRAPENIRYNLYVVDRDHRLVGVLNLRELLLAAAGQTLEEIARRDVWSIQAHETLAAIAMHPVWHEAHSLPVVDQQGTYLGAIRYRTWRTVQEAARGGRGGRDETTTDALGDLFTVGVAGVIGAFTHIAARPMEGSSDGGE